MINNNLIHIADLLNKYNHTNAAKTIYSFILLAEDNNIPTIIDLLQTAKEMAKELYGKDLNIKDNHNIALAHLDGMIATIKDLTYDSLDFQLLSPSVIASLNFGKNLAQVLYDEQTLLPNKLSLQTLIKQYSTVISQLKSYKSYNPKKASKDFPCRLCKDPAAYQGLSKTECTTPTCPNYSLSWVEEVLKRTNQPKRLEDKDWQNSLQIGQQRQSAGTIDDPIILTCRVCNHDVIIPSTHNRTLDAYYCSRCGKWIAHNFHKGFWYQHINKDIYRGLYKVITQYIGPPLYWDYNNEIKV